MSKNSEILRLESHWPKTLKKKKEEEEEKEDKSEVLSIKGTNAFSSDFSGLLQLYTRLHLSDYCRPKFWNTERWKFFD